MAGDRCEGVPAVTATASATDALLTVAAHRGVLSCVYLWRSSSTAPDRGSNVDDVGALGPAGAEGPAGADDVVLFSTLAASLIGRPIRITECPSLSLGVLPSTRARASTTCIGTSIPVQEPDCFLAQLSPPVRVPQPTAVPVTDVGGRVTGELQR